jgi:hypothetical protein
MDTVPIYNITSISSLPAAWNLQPSPLQMARTFSPIISYKKVNAVQMYFSLLGWDLTLGQCVSPQLMLHPFFHHQLSNMTDSHFLKAENGEQYHEAFRTYFEYEQVQLKSNIYANFFLY